MKTVINSRAEKFDFFLYYIFMVVFCGFTAWNAISIGGAFLPFSVVGGTCAILSAIILRSYFHHITQVRHLLQAFIVLLLLLFIGSSITEIVVFQLKVYSFTMKCALYAFCVATPIKHLRDLNKKWAEYERHK